MKYRNYSKQPMTEKECLEAIKPQHTPPRVIQDFRPDEIIIGYWREVLDIRENDEVFPVEIFIENYV